MKRGRLIFAFVVAAFYTGVLRYAQDTLGGLSALVVAPHVLLMVLGVVFNIVGLFYGAGWPAITAGILYCVAIGFALPLGGALVMPLFSAVLCFTASRREQAPAAPQYVHIVHHYEDGREEVETRPALPSQPAEAQPFPQQAAPAHPALAPADKNRPWVMAFRVAVVVIGFLLIVFVAVILSNG